MITLIISFLLLICLLFLSYILYAQKATKERLLSSLETSKILVLWFLLPTLSITLLAIFIFFSCKGENIVEILKEGISINIDTNFLATSLIPIWLFSSDLITLIAYFQKSKNDIKTDNVKEKKELKTIRFSIIFTCVLPILFFAFLLLDKSIRTNIVWLSVIITITCIFFFLMLFFLRKIKQKYQI